MATQVIQWEHLTETVRVPSGESEMNYLLKRLDAIGEQGFELVHAERLNWLNPTWLAIFKKPIIN